ncbi:MAG: DNA translocase FtsK [Acidimicrobiales bacterium]
MRGAFGYPRIMASPSHRTKSSKKSPSNRPRTRSTSTQSGGARSGARANHAKPEPVSPEALALTGVVLALALGLLGYSGLFSALGSAIHTVLATAFGHAALVVLAMILLVSVLILAHYRALAHRWRVVDLVVIAASTSGLVSVATPQGGSFLVSSVQRHGGLLGALVASVLLPTVGKTGGVIVVVLGAVVAVVQLFGVRWSEVALSLSSWLRSYTSPDAPSSSARASSPRVPKVSRAKAPRTEESGDVGDRSVEELLFDLERSDQDAQAEQNDGEAEEFIPFPEEMTEPSSASEVIDLDHAARVATARSSGEQHWRLPLRSMLGKGAKRKVNRSELIERGTVLQSSLASHGVAVKVTGMTIGPTVTRYELELGEGVKVQRILSLQRDIAYAMAAVDVRILAPIPGKSAIGVEVPNRTREMVTLGDVMNSPEMQAASHPLEVPLGQDISGAAVVMNLADMPHVLIAGATGSGKSSALNSILTSILMRATPDQVRLILIDPKRVELGQYSRLPHLLTAVVVDPKKAANALSWAVKEMESRYDLLAHYGVRDLAGYNTLVEQVRAPRQSGELFDPPTEESADDSLPQPLPFILVVVDELNDLMMVAPRDVEDSICRIAQKARAVGIHLIIATQRPSVDVITGVIKANVPSRMAFSVASLADSRVILDNPGAEKLVGRGDMLLVTASSSHPRRIQAPWVSEDEVRTVVASWRRQANPSYIEGVEGATETGTGASSGDPSREDELYQQAVDLVVSTQLGSTSMLQRKLRVGFARAGRLMDLLEQNGIVGPSEGSKPREVLVTGIEDAGDD